ncbi:PII-like signaling protein [Roseateles sp. YR242]|uniref:DUF190 domain-containing protein n=1 Tax=Roseateles sp. YR242 TaxID=1855305 RepID=UPI0008BD3810|nr:DUF190 domain-containing protein [Roseateles sp. YR242]SEL39077.1 PII-like signaling protein [Roseateles sp. YR242]
MTTPVNAPMNARLNGYQVTLYTQQDRQHGAVPLAQWLLDEARKLGLRGATLSGALQGLGHDGRVHAVNLFDVSDQPVQVTVIGSEAETQQWLDHLQAQGIEAFYVRAAVEFGTLGRG